MRSARFGFREEPFQMFRCSKCGHIIRAKFKPLPFQRMIGHECRYELVEPMTEARGSRMDEPGTDQTAV